MQVGEAHRTSSHTGWARNQSYFFRLPDVQMQQKFHSTQASVEIEHKSDFMLCSTLESTQKNREYMHHS